MPSTSTTPATASTPRPSSAQRRRHLLHRLVARTHRISDTTLVLSLLAGTGVVALGGWLVSIAHGDTVYWTMMGTLVLWSAVLCIAVLRSVPAPTPPTAAQQRRPARSEGTYRVGFVGVITELTQELAMLTRRRHRDRALITQWTELRNQAWAADRPGARGAREAVVAQWNQARAAHPSVFVTARPGGPVSAVLADDRADGRYITYPIAQRMRALRGARATISGRHLMVTTAVIAAFAAPVLAWALLQAMWQQTTTGHVVPAHLDAALGGIVWVAGVVAALVIIAIAVPTGWYVFADTARRRRLARGIGTAVGVELVWLTASLVAAAAVMSVMVGP